MKKQLKLVALLLVVMMLVALMAGCNNNDNQESSSEPSSAVDSGDDLEGDDSNQDGDADGALTEITLPIVDETVTLKYWVIQAASNLGSSMKDYGDSEAYIELENRTNVHIEWINPVAGTEKESFNLLFSSGDMPDIIATAAPTYMYSAGPEAAVQDGYFLDVTELAKQYAPNYMALINSSEQLTKDTVTDNGIRWGFTSIYQEPRLGNWGPAIRQDFLDAVGMDMPITYDDWYEVLTAFKNELGIEAPLYIDNEGLSLYSDWLAGFGVGKAFYQVDGTVKYGPVEDGFGEYIETMSKWYAEGLIDQSFSIREPMGMPSDDMVLNDKIGAAALFATWCGNEYYPSRGAVNPDFMLVGASLPVKNEGDVTHLRAPDEWTRDTVTVVSATSEYPEIAVQWIDYQFSEEGAFLMSYGVREGESYVIDADGTPAFGPLVLNNPDGLTQSEARTLYTSFTPLHEDYNRLMKARSEVQLGAMYTWTQETSLNDWQLPLSLTMTADENKQYAVIMGDITTYVQETVVNMIMGTASVTFDEFRSQLDNMGIQDAIAIYQQAMDRYSQR